MSNILALHVIFVFSAISISFADTHSRNVSSSNHRGHNAIPNKSDSDKGEQDNKKLPTHGLFNLTRNCFSNRVY